LNTTFVCRCYGRNPDRDPRNRPAARELISKINRLKHWREHGHALSAANDMLAMLGDYVKRHFDYEERFLRTHNFPGLADHIAEHATLTQRVEELFARMLEGEAIESSLVELLGEWISTHIGVEDREFVDFFGAESPLHRR
jgi:hemerythrin-like metal-binding protein